MLRNLLLSFALVCSLSLSLAPQSQAQTSAFVQVPCSRFAGSGSYSDPVRIGLVNRPAIIVGCPRLTSGRPFNVRYYLIGLPANRTANAAAGAFFDLAPGEISAVHPRLVALNGVTLLRSSVDGFWVGNPNAYGRVGRFIPLTRVPGGTYRLGVEKLDSPLRSVQTPNFNIVIIP